MPSPQAVAERAAQLSSQLSVAAFQAIWRMFSPLSPSQWWDDGTTEGIAGLAGVTASRALSQARKNGRAYAQVMLGAVNAKPKQLPAVQDVYPRAWVDTQIVYRRPVEQYRWTFSQSRSVDDALDAAQRRLEEVLDADIRRASSDEERRVYSASGKVVGYRRVIHPEMSKGGTCGLCIAASTRLYHVKDLMPIHDRCHCGTMPVTRESDPGMALNDADLKKLYAAAGSTSAADLKHVRVTDFEHGELGPLMVRRGDSIRTHQDADSKPFREPTIQDEVKKWETVLTGAQELQGLATSLINEGKSGEVEYHGRPFRIGDPESALKYYADLITQTEQRLAVAVKQAA